MKWFRLFWNGSDDDVKTEQTNWNWFIQLRTKLMILCTLADWLTQRRQNPANWQKTQLTSKWFNQVSNDLRHGQLIQCKVSKNQSKVSLVKERMVQLVNERLNSPANGLMARKVIQRKVKWKRQDWNGLVKERMVQLIADDLTHRPMV